MCGQVSSGSPKIRAKETNVNRKSKPTIGPVEFIDRVMKRDKKGEPFALAPYQRRVLEIALRRDPSVATHLAVM